MKMIKRKNKIITGFILFVFLFLASQRPQGQQQAVPQSQILTFPFSQFVIRNDWAAPIVWKYQPYKTISESETVIAPPDPGADWTAWYRQMKSYQSFLRSNLNDTSSLYLEVSIRNNNKVRLNYKRALNHIRLQPNDKIYFNGLAKNDTGASRFSIRLIFIRKGEEQSHMIARSQDAGEAIINTHWASLHTEITIPDFDTANLVVQPVVFFDAKDSASAKIDIKSLTLSIPRNEKNMRIFYELSSSFNFKSTGIDKQLYNRREMRWIKSNFISGFAYLWDHDFWDSNKKMFTVQKYCDKMKREFGGFQSVLIWFGYPNIGIDSNNIWDMIDAIPGGINGLRDIISVFHKNKVKVYFPYMPWEIDTRRTNIDDAVHWATIINKTDADGLFFDTWFDAGDFQKELDKFKKGVSIGTEHHPTLQNAQSYYAITTSWGQTLTPYNNNGISRVKWLIPEHIQWTISRWQTNRQDNMAYSWINGQGILVWENVFGHMNAWNAADRQALRKINSIYQHFGYLYTSDSWKPYLPSDHGHIHISSWENTRARVWNIIADKENAVNEYTLQVDDEPMSYYDLWSGEKLTVKSKKVTVPLKRFSCVLGLKDNPTAEVVNLLKKQKSETANILQAADKHSEFLLANNAKPFPEVIASAVPVPKDMLELLAGGYNLINKHVKRETDCFPDMNAKGNYENKVENGMIIHQTNIKLPVFKIMPRVVTNASFQEFTKATNYQPADKANYLRHWKGSVCPDSLLDKPVVYVTLDDARAYANWAGMRLPTEWEWQAAAEKFEKEFIFNEVFEWNESERFDGHNNFVTLRGGCQSWSLPTSHWYFPGTPDQTKSPGGAQPNNSHCKYFIMKTGLDRAATLGFRCLK